jgi:alanine-synthesizing transaminase
LRASIVSPYVFNITAELKLAAAAWRGHHRHEHGQPRWRHAAAHRGQARRGRAAPDTHGYSASKGIPRLRRAISHWYKRRYDVEIDPDSEAIVTIGSKEGLAHLMLATLDGGDTVLVPDPSYPSTSTAR